jgi:hypothetical protein
MSCCSSKEEVLAFVKQKAGNFRDLLTPYCSSPEHQEFLHKYKDDDIQTLTHLYLSPLYSTNTLMIARDSIVSQLNIQDKDVQEKVLRYLTMFCELLL